jgi:hypothetical protein
MKIGKVKFKNIKDILSRDEMKRIMAGSDGGLVCGACTWGSTVPCISGGPGSRCLCPYTNTPICY